MSHTPGPWHADKYGKIWRNVPSDLYEYGGKIAGDMPLAFVSKGWYEKDETPYPQQANAHLIAAAPDMLEALEEVMGELDVEGLPCPLCGRNLTIGHRHNCLWHVVASAIRKARGEE